LLTLSKWHDKQLSRLN